MIHTTKEMEMSLQRHGALGRGILIAGLILVSSAQLCWPREQAPGCKPSTCWSKPLPGRLPEA